MPTAIENTFRWIRRVNLVPYCFARLAQQARYGHAVRLAGAWAFRTILPLHRTPDGRFCHARRRAAGQR